ncbi:MAG: hypothetical protein WCO03_01560 [bacterium]
MADDKSRGNRPAVTNLEFFRHDEKGKSVDGQPDQAVTLTPKGKEHAKTTAKLSPEEASRAIAYGSPRVRAQETSALHMAGKKLKGTESLDEMKTSLRREAKSIATDPNKKRSQIFGTSKLDFDVDEKSLFGREEIAAFSEGRLLRYLVKDSDRRAEELGDTKNITYSRTAAQVAEVVGKFINVTKRRSSLLKGDRKNKVDNVINRFLGSHQTVTETFLAKVIEKTRGVGERDKFVDSLGGKGFDFSEGFGVKIIAGENGEPTVEVKFEHPKTDKTEQYSFTGRVNADIIKDIIKEGQESVDRARRVVEVRRATSISQRSSSTFLGKITHGLRYGLITKPRLALNSLFRRPSKKKLDKLQKDIDSSKIEIDYLREREKSVRRKEEDLGKIVGGLDASQKKSLREELKDIRSKITDAEKKRKSAIDKRDILKEKFLNKRDKILAGPLSRVHSHLGVFDTRIRNLEDKQQKLEDKISSGDMSEKEIKKARREKLKILTNIEKQRRKAAPWLEKENTIENKMKEDVE